MDGTLENKRDTKRSVYLGEGIKVNLKDLDEKKSIHGEITSLSPWEVNLYTLVQKQVIYPSKGESVKIFYTTEQKKTCYSVGRIIHVSEENINELKYKKIEIEFLYEVTDDEVAKKNKTYQIPETFAPHCWSEDPFFFQEKLIFKVKAIYSDGMILVTSARNKTLFPNWKTTSSQAYTDLITNGKYFSSNFFMSSRICCAI